MMIRIKEENKAGKRIRSWGEVAIFRWILCLGLPEKTLSE
jgi:hypothetical protein